MKKIYVVINEGTVATFSNFTNAFYYAWKSSFGANNEKEINRAKRIMRENINNEGWTYPPGKDNYGVTMYITYLNQYDKFDKNIYQNTWFR